MPQTVFLFFESYAIQWAKNDGTVRITYLVPKLLPFEVCNSSAAKQSAAEYW